MFEYDEKQFYKEIFHCTKTCHIVTSKGKTPSPPNVQTTFSVAILSLDGSPKYVKSVQAKNMISVGFNTMKNSSSAL